DEPTNHLDLDSILWLETYLRRFSGSLFFVTHDRAFLQRLATRIVELDRGRLTSWECDYSTFLRRKDSLLHAEEEQWNQFDKKLAQEEVWIRQGIKARRTRNEGRVRALEQLRVLRSERRERSDAAKMTIQQAERSGRKVITVKNLSHVYESDGRRRVILDRLATTIMRGDKVGIIGPNGCGKTTLLNLLLGRLAVQQGTVEHGTRLEISYFDQHRHKLDDSRDVLYNAADGNEFVVINGNRRHVIGYLQDFLFSPDRVRQPVRCLSGGERNRLLLARLFTQPSNVLVLDEPTNDLDTETLELLETLLVDYPGTVLLVSHDRVFLDNICTNTLVFEGDGVVNEYVGGYSDWQRCINRRPDDSIDKNRVSAKPAARAPTQKKLTNKERETWEQLLIRIEEMENELHDLQHRMASADFYRGRPEEIKTVSERVTALPELIEQGYAQWADLDARR
ncbi:MAG: ATP-binding cassette domain-containing protein, partial [Kiritimatiellae bacterium]|nr:ATP-binding cassette domain-containing protein [Kiritimatiellia bacterium]